MKSLYRKLYTIIGAVSIAASLIAHENQWIDTVSSQSCLPLTMPDNFGITHFIVGYPYEKLLDHPRKEHKTENKRTSSNAHTTALFSPDDDIQQAIIELIDNEQEVIKIAIFTFTDLKIAQALINAYKRGVAIEIVTDPSQCKDRYSKISLLQQAGISVFEYNPNYIKDMRSNLMHHKFGIFGKTSCGIVITGSFNFTRAAGERNQENMVKIKDETIVSQFSQQFDRLKQRCLQCTSNRKHLTCAHCKKSVAPEKPSKKLACASLEPKLDGKKTRARKMSFA